APTSLSLADKKHVGSLLLRPSVRDLPTLAASCFSNTSAGSVDDFAAFASRPEGLQRLGKDVGRFLVGAALLDVRQVSLVRLDLRRWRWVPGVGAGEARRS